MIAKQKIENAASGPLDPIHNTCNCSALRDSLAAKDAAIEGLKSIVKCREWSLAHGQEVASGMQLLIDVLSQERDEWKARAEKTEAALDGKSV